MNLLIVPCQCCHIEGRIYVTDFDSENGCWGERDTGECPWCEGTGGEIVETQPITIEDLDEEFAE